MNKIIAAHSRLENTAEAKVLLRLLKDAIKINCDVCEGEGHDVEDCTTVKELQQLFKATKKGVSWDNVVEFLIEKKGKTLKQIKHEPIFNVPVASTSTNQIERRREKAVSSDKNKGEVIKKGNK